ncbi:MAG: nitric oxide reductase transcriptional regulator NorR [Planctomycetes bacterium]|nr:nitric oxide reductase transcriptional regulator NorR [Planctomycetota bacterium]
MTSIARQLEDLLPIARDITASLSTEDRPRRLVEAVHRALPCDAVALLRRQGDTLVALASRGLTDDVYGRRFVLGEHPRLDIICKSTTPTRFPDRSPLPDPYDGLVKGAPELGGHVHSCLGCPLIVEGELVGVLTADALVPRAFDGIGDAFLAHLAALAGAALRTIDLVEALERRAELQGIVARDLLQDVMDRRGTELLGASSTTADLRREVELIARSDFPVLVRGETGVGKELVVRMLHSCSSRGEKPLVYVNCAAIPESVFESELFGHVRGAFTGADSARLGKFRVADGACLFLDEIGELPRHVQPKLLRALQEGEVQCVGSDDLVRVDVRIFAATNRDLEAEVAAGRFRADLLHRLDVCRIDVPPLRDRPEDVPTLAGHFADRARRRLGTGPIRFTSEAQSALMKGRWPGNVRELENVISRGVLRASGRTAWGETVLVRGADLDLDSNGAEPSRSETLQAPPTAISADPILLRDAVDDFKRRLVTEAIARNEGNWAAAARDLGLQRGNLHHLARRLGLKNQPGGQR